MAMKLGVIVNEERDAAMEFADRLVGAAVDRGLAALTEGEEVPGDDWQGEQFDVVVAVGGDGTVLRAVQRALELDVPVLGFNLGTVGFLAEAEPDQLETVLDRLAEGSVRVVPKMTLEATTSEGVVGFGVNDVVIEKIESQRLVALDVAIDDEYFLTYRADGVVIATPTGSTAYTFSAGGPLIDPEIEAIAVSAVAPHSLFDRTVVLAPTARIRCTVTADRPVQASVDGRELGILDAGSWVDVARSSRRVGFVTFDHESFPRRVRDRLGLGQGHAR